MNSFWRLDFWISPIRPIVRMCSMCFIFPNPNESDEPRAVWSLALPLSGLRYVEERNKVLQHMEQLQQQKIFLEPWTAKWKKPAREVFSTCSEMTWDSMRFWFAGSKFQFGTWTQSVCGYLLYHVLARTAACRKLPGKLLTEIGERYLFSTSDGSLESKTSLVASEMAFTFQMILKLVMYETCAEKKHKLTMPQDISTCLKFHGFWW